MVFSGLTSRFLALVSFCLCHAAALSAATRFGAIDYTAESGASLEIPVGMTSTDGVSCVQFDLIYDPAVLTPGSARSGEAAPNHKVSSTLVTPGRLRVVLYSTDLTPLDGGYVVRVPGTWIANGSASAAVDGVTLVTTGGSSVTVTSNDLSPQVVSAPSASRVRIGGSRTLTVAATGVGTLTYQWYLNGTAIAGATEASYTIANATNASLGTYSVTVTSEAGSVSAPSFAVTVSLPATLINISTRASVLTGDSVLIPGFAVRGEPGSLKRFLVRAVGPRLADLGIPANEVLADPMLELVRVRENLPPLTIKTNDNWVLEENAATIATVSQQAGAFSLDGRPDSVLDEKSSAMLVDLEPGNYTAIARGKANQTGVAIVEVYEVSGSQSRLVNISNRGFVGAGSQVMIPGFAIQGNERGRFLIRAVGFGLKQFGLAEAGLLKNPRIAVFRAGDSKTEIASNDDWDNPANSPATLAAVSAQAGAFALTAGTRDAALVADLDPGVYTVVCNSSDGGTGTALVEVYLVE